MAGNHIVAVGDFPWSKSKTRISASHLGFSVRKRPSLAWGQLRCFCAASETRRGGGIRVPQLRRLLVFAKRELHDFDTWHAKVLQRAKAYGFTMATQCAGVRRGQRYCRSFQKLRGGAAPREIARTEYADVCGAIAAQQRATGRYIGMGWPSSRR